MVRFDDSQRWWIEHFFQLFSAFSCLSVSRIFTQFQPRNKRLISSEMSANKADFFPSISSLRKSAIARLLTLCQPTAASNFFQWQLTSSRRKISSEVIDSYDSEINYLFVTVDSSRLCWFFTQSQIEQHFLAPNRPPENPF